MKHFVYNIPKDSPSTVGGSCGNGTTDQMILIHWSDGNTTNALNMSFTLNATSHEFSLSEIAFELDQALLPIDSNFVSRKFYHIGSVFETPKDHAYHCTRVQELNITNSANDNGTVSFTHTLLEAFHVGNSQQFSTVIDCDAISTPGIFQKEYR